MKWIGQHIYDLVARFRNDVYLEDLSTTTETNVLVVDSTGKVSKTTVITGDVTGVTAGSNITVTNPTGPVPTVALSTNVDVAGALDVTSFGTFDASVTVAGNVDVAGTLDVTSLATFYAEVTIADNVGIGTTSPGSTLDVNGIISVGNSIGTQFGNDNLIRARNGASAFLNIKGGEGRAKINIANDSLTLVGGTGTGGGIYFNTGAAVNNGGTQKMVLHSTGGLSLGNGYTATDPGAGNMIITGKVGIGTATPLNKLDIVGSLGRGAPVTKTTNFTVAATENWLIMNGTATITITLPTASSFTGRELMIKNIAAYTVISASSNVKPIDTNTAATAILPATAGSWCTLVSDGTNWVTMMN